VHLSIILPTLHRLATARALAARLVELTADMDVEILIVSPDVDTGATDGRIRFIEDQGGGVYPAYTRGLHAAQGAYVWFIGDDDFPLDGAAAILSHIKTQRADLIVAPVLFSSGRLYRPTRSRFVLLFRNWCQQGVIYKRSALLRYRFYRRLRVQADHFVNILMHADKSLHAVFLQQPICVFGVNGLTARHRDHSFRAVRPALARRTLPLPEFLLFQSIVCAVSLFRRARRARP
jgi:glycosyltransferase involved in cell wall biosynthesis